MKGGIAGAGKGWGWEERTDWVQQVLRTICLSCKSSQAKVTNYRRCFTVLHSANRAKVVWSAQVASAASTVHRSASVARSDVSDGLGAAGLHTASRLGLISLPIPLPRKRA